MHLKYRYWYSVSIPKYQKLRYQYHSGKSGIGASLQSIILKKARKVEFTAHLFTHNWISINRVHANSGPWRTADPWNGVEGLADVDVEVRRLLPVYIFIDSCVVTSEMDQRTQVNLVGSVPN